MVAYSFKRRFVEPIRRGFVSAYPDAKGVRPKRQTIRANRKRHARTGEEIQLYHGMRTKHCFLIGRVRCTTIEDIRIDFNQWPKVYKDSGHCEDALNLDAFARDDGFDSWFEMFQFWRETHGTIVMFWGKLIRWEPL